VTGFIDHFLIVATINYDLSQTFTLYISLEHTLSLLTLFSLDVS
jgi:hypothetical protein